MTADRTALGFSARMVAVIAICRASGRSTGVQRSLTLCRDKVRQPLRETLLHRYNWQQKVKDPHPRVFFSASSGYFFNSAIFWRSSKAFRSR